MAPTEGRFAIPEQWWDFRHYWNSIVKVYYCKLFPKSEFMHEHKWLVRHNSLRYATGNINKSSKWLSSLVFRAL